MTQIKIEVPANDTIALNAFAEALQRIASERSVTTKVDVKAKYGEPVTDYITSGQMDKELKHAEQLNDVAIDALDKELDEVENHHIHSGGDLSQGVTTAMGGEVTVTVNGVKCEPVEYEQINIKRDNTLDNAGIPWDGRIHSKGKSRLADDTWRLRKRPADKDEGEWSAYVESVKSELLAVQNAPSVTTDIDVNDIEYQKIQGVIAPDCKVEVTLSDEQFEKASVIAATKTFSTELEGVTPNGDTVTVPDAEAGEPCPPVTSPSAVVPPVAAVTPPTSLTPPVTISVGNTKDDEEEQKFKNVTDAILSAPPLAESTVTTFPQLMKYITSDAAKRGATNILVKEALVKTDPSLIAIPLIGGRIDLIPQFIKNLEELIGE